MKADIMQPSGNEYLTQAVLTASPMELIRMLYEGGLSAVETALSRLRDGSILERGRAISKAMNIVQELRVSLDGSQPDLHRKLGNLYSYMEVSLQQAHVQSSESKLLEMAKVFRSLIEGSRSANVASGSASYETDTAFEPVQLEQNNRTYAYTAAAYGGQVAARNWQA